MNHFQLNTRNEAIRSALAVVGSELTPEGDSGWRLSLLNGAPHFVTAKIVGDWLVLEAESFHIGQETDAYWQALGRNASLAGLAKIVLSNDGRGQIRAELPLQDGVEISARIGEAFDGFADAWSATEHPSAPAAPPLGDAGPIDLKHLCAEAGWVFTERTGGKLVVELEVPGNYYQAVFLPTGQGVRISCELAELDSVTEPGRFALAGLLLAASGHIRMARASVSQNGGPPVAQFEILFETAPSPFEISSALETLSVACSLCGEEIKSLQNPVIAERYLALRGRGSMTMAGQNERTAE